MVCRLHCAGRRTSQLHLRFPQRSDWCVAAYALIAEFDRQQTEVYRKSVEQQGIDAVIVRDGDAARRVLQARGAPILLICDLSLPQADGFSVIAELRRT